MKKDELENLEGLIHSDFFPVKNNLRYISAANVAPTNSRATKKIIEWQENLMLYGNNRFTDEEEKNAYLNLREASSKLLNTSKNNIACGSSATVLLSSFAWSLCPKKDSNIVSTEASFPSTVYPWKRISMHTGAKLKLAPHDKNYYTKIEDIVSLINESTAVVCVPHVEFTNGQVYDLKYLASVAHKYNALLVVDATQSAGVIPIDVNNEDIDVLVSASYKWLCGAFGSAFMYIKPTVYKELTPGLLGFRSHKDMWNLQAKRIELCEDADKFEFDTTHFGSAYGLAESINFLLEIGIKNIYNHDISLADKLIHELKKFNIVKIITPYYETKRSPIVTIKILGHDTEKIINCLRENKIIVSNRSGYIRFSPHLYNTMDDIDFTLKVLEKIMYHSKL